MTPQFAEGSLPRPPERLSAGEVTLEFDGVVPGDSRRGIVPYYHFYIRNQAGEEVGTINLRVGDTDHVRVTAGHIGFGIHSHHRGHGYARQACRALAPLVRAVYEAVIITCDPDNLASRRTIERLGATFMDEVTVPPHDPHYLRGSRTKLRFLWTP